MPTFYLCPGAHKTGSTALQTALSKNRSGLQQKGVHYVERSEFFKSDLWPYLKSFRGASGPARAEDLPAPVRAEAETMFPADMNLILSIENLFGEVSRNTYPGVSTALRIIQAAAPKHDLKIVYYIRRQDSFIESSYIQRIHKGTYEEFAAYWDMLQEADLDWLGIVGRMEAEVGRDAITLRAFETIKKGYRRYALDFFNIVAPGYEPDIVEDANSNVSLSEPAIKIAKRAFSLIEDEDARRQLVRILQKHAGNDKYRRAKFIEVEQIQALKAKYALSNGALFDSWNLDRSLRDYYLFSETKSA
jgi:hypothetical protein